MDQSLIAYALDALPPPDADAVRDRLRRDPFAAEQVARVRAALAPTLGGDDIPPPRLAERTLARVRAAAPRPRRAVVPAGLVEPDLREGRWGRRDVLALAALVLLTVGLVVPAVGAVQRERASAWCQNGLREQYVALAGHADAHAGFFPRVSESQNGGRARDYLDALAARGYLPEGAGGCPADTPAARPAGFAYPLGYRDAAGTLVGPHRAAAGGDEFTPLLGDRPPGVGPEPVGFHAGRNVLYVAGHVRRVSDTRAGVANDDIYTSARGRVEAGRDRWDGVLGWDRASP